MEEEMQEDGDGDLSVVCNQVFTSLLSFMIDW